MTHTNSTDLLAIIYTCTCIKELDLLNIIHVCIIILVLYTCSYVHAHVSKNLV